MDGAPGQRRARAVARAVGIDGHVEAWGDWGFAVQDDARDSIVLFTDAGEIKEPRRGGSSTPWAPAGWRSTTMASVCSALVAASG